MKPKKNVFQKKKSFGTVVLTDLVAGSSRNIKNHRFFEKYSEEKPISAVFGEKQPRDSANSGIGWPRVSFSRNGVSSRISRFQQLLRWRS